MGKNRLYGLSLFLTIVFSTISVHAELWDQGYVDSEPQLLNCGQACIGSPEIQNYLYTDYQIQQKGLYIEQDGVDWRGPAIPWAQSRKKWLRKFGRSLYRNQDVYRLAAFRIGIRIQDEDKSAHSAIWREIRKPLLYSLRNQLTDAFKKRIRGKGGARVGTWAVEQGLDIGASMAGLDSNGRAADVVGSDDFTEKESVVSSVSPKIDPWKGRYGIRVKIKSFQGLRDPNMIQLSYYYCESSWGLGDRICAYLHQYQVAWGYRYRAYGQDMSFHISVYYESKSLDPDAYIVDNEPYDHKPWGFQTQFRMSI